jgi:long-subunit fatty acid transport protein
VPRNYGNGHTFRFGAEWMATRRLALRAGLERDISGMPKVTGGDALASPTYSPTLPDSNSWAVAGGLGFAITPSFAVNASVFYAKMDEVQSTAPTNTASGPLPGRYDPHVIVYALGIVYDWQPGARVVQPM